MKVIFAPDSFKGSLSAETAAAAMAEGWRCVFPEVDALLLPVADGGEGTRQALVSATKGSNISVTVTGPLGAPLRTCWGLLGDRETAVVELADAAGLTLLSPEERDPKYTTTYGVGELILAAATFPGVRRVIVGLGGSATNDGGAGLLAALGVTFRDHDGTGLPFGGQALASLATVDCSGLRLEPGSVEIQIACDVNNPLTGSRGASAIFGPQKGATPDDVALLDAALQNYARILGFDETIPGSGAAGGTAAGLLYLFPTARLIPGIHLVLDTMGFDNHLKGSDLVITGEGRLDGQTLGGKVIAGVGQRARTAGVPVAAIVGGITADVDANALAERTGVRALLPVVPGPCTLEEAMRNAEPWLRDAAARAASWFSLSYNAANKSTVFPSGSSKTA
jgi:glycerate kinase